MLEDVFKKHLLFLVMLMPHFPRINCKLSRKPNLSEKRNKIVSSLWKIGNKMEANNY